MNKMKSEDMHKYGLKNWIAFSEVIRSDNSRKKLQQAVGVYVFRLNKEFGRLKGKYDILYIGHSSN